MNGGRGLQFGLADRKNVAEKLLIALSKRNITWFDEQIASHVEIHRSTVAKVRADLAMRHPIPAARQVVRGNQMYTMTSGQPYVYEPDELLDTMPNDDRYIEPPAKKQSSRAPIRTQTHSARRVLSSEEYRPPPPMARLQPAQVETVRANTAPPTAEDRLFWQLFMASGIVPPADGVTFVLGWRLRQAGNVQFQGFAGPITPADELHEELYTALLNWLGGGVKGKSKRDRSCKLAQ